MRYFLCLASALAAVVTLAAQPIPGRYIVEFQTEPAAALASAGRVNLAAVAGPALARRLQIQAEHAAVEPAIRALGGRVTRHFDTVANGMVVEIPDSAAPQLRQLSGVRGVYPDVRHKLNLDHAVNVHHISDAWQTLANGMPGAGAGIKIGMLDSGIDINHPGFQGFTTPIPNGFPIVSSKAETPNTNNKVIVSRDYTGDGGLDMVVGHGTGTSMMAAGLTNNPAIPGVGPITGAAPGAWLGNYRVIDDSGSGALSWFMAALQDAVNDGMNVINYSAGGPDLQLGSESGIEARAIAAALSAGTVVVIAAGNNGPDPGTIGDPGVVASALTVGANENERYFDFAVILGTLPPYEAVVPSAEFGSTSGQLSDPLTDVTALDGNGYGCGGFPSASLTAQIALISRGGAGGSPCSFDTKINNAQKAGAVAAIIYDNQAEAQLLDMSLATATLPATFVSQASGQDMLAHLASAPGTTATVDFTGTYPFSESSDILAAFSSGGPTPGGGVKPDLVAVGDSVITACTTFGGCNLDPTYPNYQFGGGTSFSSPLVTGAVAVLMGARPGLTAAQYRSLIVNSAPPLLNPDTTPVTPQVAGAGKMNLLRALQNSLAASPTAVDFQTGSGTVDSVKTVAFTNTGTAADTFTVVVNAINTSGPAASVDVSTFTLAPGASQNVAVHLTGSRLATGEYHGFLTVTGSQGSAATRVPYWFAVPGTAVKHISVQSADPGPYSTGDTATIVIRSTDAVGLPLDGGTPTVSVTGVRPRTTIVPTGDIPGTYEIDVRIGGADANGLNAVTVSVGGVTEEIDLFVQ